MMKKEELRTVVETMPREELLSRVSAWAEKHDDFKDFLLKGYLLKSEDEKNEKAEKLNFELMMLNSLTNYAPVYKRGRYSDYYDDEITDWSSIYTDVVEPYESKMEEMSTEEVAEFGAAIMAMIIPRLGDEDFMGDDWYGDDYYSEIGNIVEAAREAVKEAVLREDFNHRLGDILLHALEAAGENEELKSYVDGHWEALAKLVEKRMHSKEVKAELFDALANADSDKRGKWIRRKVDFLESKGRKEEAQEIILHRDDLEEIRDLIYERKVAEEKWDEIFALIDKWMADDEKKGTYGVKMKWEDMQLELAKRTGRKELMIKRLTDMFLYRYDRDKYYDELKAVVKAEEWKEFYVKLLQRARQSVDVIGNFLAKEGETEWLYRLICKENMESPISYHQMITYYPWLKKEHGEDLRQRINRAFLKNAQARFSKGCVCKNEWYESFCGALRDFYRIGGKEEVPELVEHFLVMYKTRRNLVAELRKVQQLYAGK